MKPIRHLVLIFGDQLNRDSLAFEGFDTVRDRVWMAEVPAEATYAWSHKQRIVLFLAAMRHFRNNLEEGGISVDYTELGDPGNAGTLEKQLQCSLERDTPERVVMVQPGEYRVLTGVQAVCREAKVEVEVREDEHFYCSPKAFDQWADGKKSLVMEFFYREMRKRYGILMQADGKTPEGGTWNFDKSNRGSFGRRGPMDLPPAGLVKPDPITRAVMEEVNARFADHPGSLDTFNWPVTRRAALSVLRHFIEQKLPCFGKYQDAMWGGEPFLYHSLISASLNLKLLNPREVVERAERAFSDGLAPIEAVEGFVRQVLGWREYVRGIYWRYMPDYLEMNEMGADQPLPAFYWDGDTPLACLRETISGTLKNGYAHHIQRLMVTGLYALLLGVKPREVEDWYLGIYVDAVEWVTLPNTLGMSQYGDGGIMASKPYIATGKYIKKMSNYCSTCPKNPELAEGADACPFTTLYWDYLIRHESKLKANQRMALQVRNLAHLSDTRRAAIRKQAEWVRNCPSMAIGASATPS